MAVVQISKIQVRRGRKNSNTGLPQLASGELGWAVDTQELYIGNGAVSEGAPYVGNTKILTEFDNILELVEQYEYKKFDVQTGSSVNFPVSRSIQQRLDETVYVEAFGAVPDCEYDIATDTFTGGTDNTAAIQRALNELYLGDATIGAPKSRIVLRFQPGVYKINTAALKIPPYAILEGAGKDKTIILQTGNYSVIETIGARYINEGLGAEPGPLEGVTPIGELTQSQHVEIRGITFRSTDTTYPVAKLVCTKDSIFDSVKFRGAFDYEGALYPFGTESIGVQLVAKSSMVTCKNNVFDRCEFEYLSYAIESEYDIEANTFQDCSWSYCGESVTLGRNIDGLTTGKQFGANNNKISTSRFYQIRRYAINIANGKGNLSKGNTFIRVGNDGGDSSSTVKTSIIHFGEVGNVDDGSYFERSIDLVPSQPTDTYVSDSYIGEYEGRVKGNHKFNNDIELIPTSSTRSLLRLPAFETGIYKVHYEHRSTISDSLGAVTSSISRSGTMIITMNLQDASPDSADIQLVDEYNFVGPQSKAENLTFSATLNSGCVLISYRNISENNANNVYSGKLNFWYEVIS